MRLVLHAGEAASMSSRARLRRWGGAGVRRQIAILLAVQRPVRGHSRPALTRRLLADHPMWISAAKACRMCRVSRKMMCRWIDAGLWPLPPLFASASSSTNERTWRDGSLLGTGLQTPFSATTRLLSKTKAARSNKDPESQDLSHHQHSLVALAPLLLICMISTAKSSFRARGAPKKPLGLDLHPLDRFDSMSYS